jgi:hypothetical protein
MTIQQATDLIADNAYENNMGIIEHLIYLRENYKNLSEELQNAYCIFYYHASDMFAPVPNEHHIYSEHSE